jgi:hypothetical protein
MRGIKRSRQRRATPRRQTDVLRDVLLGAAQCDSWLTLRELARVTGYGEASISAQLRNLRKPQYGAYRVEKRCRDESQPGPVAVHGAVWEYRLRRGRGRGRGQRQRERNSPSWLTIDAIRAMVGAAKQVCAS